MPGILGLVNLVYQKQTQAMLFRMSTSFVCAEEYQKETFEDVENHIAFSRLHLGVFYHGAQPIYSNDQRLVILFDGELYDNSSGKSDPEFVLERYQHLQDACAKGIDGIYAFVILDYNRKVLKIFSDHFGLKPVYYYQSSSLFAFASEVKAILPLHEGPKRRDNKTIANFFTFGFPLGDETLFEDIKLIPAASCLTYDLTSRKVSIQKYWHLVDLFTSKGQHNGKKDYQDVVDAFTSAVNRRLANSEQLGLSLSGGLDSRSILAALGDRAKGLRTYTLGLKNCRDESLAQKMSAITGTRHDFVEVNLDFLSRYKESSKHLIFLTDGLFHPREGTELVALNYFKQSPFKVLLRGHGGEIGKAALAYPVMVDQELISKKDKQSILQWLLNKGNHILPAADAGRIFSPLFYSEIKNHTAGYLSKLLEEPLEMLESGDIAIYFYIDQFSRRFTIPSLDIFRTEVEIRLPYFDLQYLKLLLAMPIAKRFRGDVQHHIVRHCQPKLVKVPDSNTGAPLDATLFQLYVQDKFNSLLRKISFPGYRHYTEYSSWQRKYFKKNMAGILFSDYACQRNIYNPTEFETLYKDHMSGKIDAGAFLGTAVGIELWCRQFFDVN